MAFGPSCEFAPLVPARVTFHSRLALSRSCVSTAHAARSVPGVSLESQREPCGSHLAAPATCAGLAASARRASAPSSPLGFVHPCDGLLPIVPRGRRRSLPQRSRDSPFEACPHPDGYRFPGPCPPAVPWWRSSARCGSASGLRAPDEVPRGPGSTRRCFLGIALQGLPLAALAHGFCFPGPSSSALCALPPCGLQHPALWSLA
jgi:hypothetical protein